MQPISLNNTELRKLRAIFVASGHDLWLVGGCVRDALTGIEPKDIDLATSANPDEQIAIYTENDLRFIPTGLQHGTVTVVLDQPYEITSLRTESDHDGRWATMAYTRDLSEDLSRRDLTINAMAMDFDGNVIDPFGGRADLEAKRVRFVGDAAERMREDYLRILRFFRFHARFAGAGSPEAKAATAIREARDGLAKISAERIWMEMAKIITGPFPAVTVSWMRDYGLFEIIGMPEGFIGAFDHAQERGVTDPATVMAWSFFDDHVETVARRWKWSSGERTRAQFIFDNRSTTDMTRFKEMLVDGVDFEWVSDLMRLNDVDTLALEVWEVPRFPVTGADLIARGMKPGPDMGRVIKDLTRKWKDSDYTLSVDDLLMGVAQ
jgi:tRNA nucleotidyltransferase (CCA-adding enzyme)